MRVEEALKTSATLSRQAEKLGLQGADGQVLKFKVTHTKGVNGYGVKAVEMVEKLNLLSKLPFWIDVDTPIYLDPSSETYHSM